MLSQEDVRFLAILVQKGQLPQSAAEKLLAASTSPESGDSVEDLDDLLVRLNLLDSERIRFLRQTGGENVPSIPGYDYLACAGAGGTSLVFQIQKKSGGEKSALKVMHRDLHADQVQKKRFVSEARMLIDLDHPNIVKGFRVGHITESDGFERLVFMMEWVPGRSILQLIRGGHDISEDLALYVILRAAKALQAMHAAGILHRDVKPDNILLTGDNTVKLIDLGFATQLVGSEDDPEGGSDDTTLGTAAYMSPEQARGTGDLDVRSDIYSLGATLFQMAVGELPFSGEGNQEQLAARILETLSSPELQSRRISPHMNYFIRKMMEQDRDFRYSSIEELAGDIEQQIKGKKSLDFINPDDGGGSTVLDKSLNEDSEPGSDDPPSGDVPKFPKRRRRR